MKRLKETIVPKVESPMVIRINPWEVSVGHPTPCCGLGVHLDKRQRRQRTRSAAARRAVADSSDT